MTTTTTDPLWQATVDVADYLADLWPRIPALTAPEIGTWHRELEHAKIHPDEVIPLAMRYRDAGHDFPPHSVSSLLKYVRPLREDNARRADRTYQTEQPALPPSKGSLGWADFSRGTYGELVGLNEAVRRRHAELEGLRVSSQGSRLPGDDGWLEDGVNLPIRCRSMLCDVHRDRPLVVDDEGAVL